MFISPRILLKKVGLNYFYFYACKIGIAQLLVICLIILNFKYVYTEYLVFFLSVYQYMLYVALVTLQRSKCLIWPEKT